MDISARAISLADRPQWAVWVTSVRMRREDRSSISSRGHIHAIAEDVATVDHHISDIDANAELNPLFLRHVGIALCHAALNIDSAAHRVHDATELSKQPISGVLDNPPTMLSDLGIDERAQVILEPSVRALFVQAGQAA